MSIRTSCGSGGLDTAHYCVQMQVVRRGGLRSGRAIPPEEVDGRVKQLREAAQIEQDEKVATGRRQAASRRAAGAAHGAEGASPAGEGEKIGWLPPTELTCFGPTEAEESLRLTLEGPSTTWCEDAHPAECAPPGATFGGIGEGDTAARERALRDLEDLDDRNGDPSPPSLRQG